MLGQPFGQYVGVKQIARWLLGLALATGPVGYADSSHAKESATTFRVGAYTQGRFRSVQNDPVAVSDENGFSLNKVRPYFLGQRELNGRLKARLRIEGELQPQFQMVDASVGMVWDDRYSIDVGQQRTPMSRLNLTSDAVLSFPDMAAVATLAPGRQIGAVLRARDPWTDWVTASVGIFNGEGRNQTQNVDEAYLYAGRLAVTPFGKDRYAESAFGGDFLTVGFSAAHNSLEVSENRETTATIGVDIAGSYMGLAGMVEYLQVKHAFANADASPNYRANGFVAQLTYLLPKMDGVFGRFEAGARFDEVDRNDTLPISAPGDENQSLRSLTGVLTYYLDEHDLKISASYAHVVEVEDLDSIGNDASYDNDMFLIQVTYRGER